MFWTTTQKHGRLAPPSPTFVYEHVIYCSLLHSWHQHYRNESHALH